MLARKIWFWAAVKSDHYNTWHFEVYQKDEYASNSGADSYEADTNCLVIPLGED